jgi:hypothetical protein
MGLSWIDVSLITLLITLAGVLTAQSLIYLNQRDSSEALRNRQAACKLHEWMRNPNGLICRRCGKTPG